MINTNNIVDYHLDIIYTKMFEMVNLDWKNPEVRDEYVKDKEWYLKNEWTQEQMDEYIKWLADYLYSSAGARRALMGYPIKNKKRCKAVASLFTSWYGWKTKKEQ